MGDENVEQNWDRPKINSMVDYHLESKPCLIVGLHMSWELLERMRTGNGNEIIHNLGYISDNIIHTMVRCTCEIR